MPMLHLPHCTPATWHTYHMALMASWHSWHHGTPTTAITCHAYATPIPCLHRARARAARRHRVAGHTSRESMRRRAGAMREASATPHVRRRGRIRRGGDGGRRYEGPGGQFDASTARAVGSLMSRARTAAGAKTTGPFSPTPPAPAMRFPSLTPPFPAQLSLTPRLSFLGVLPFTSLPSNLTPLCGLATKERAERGAAEGCLKPRAFWPLTAFLPHLSRLICLASPTTQAVAKGGAKSGTEGGAKSGTERSRAHCCSRPGTGSASLLLRRTRCMYTWRRGRPGGG